MKSSTPLFQLGINNRFRSASLPRHFRDIEEFPIGKLTIAGSSIEAWQHRQLSKSASIDIYAEEFVDITKNDSLDHAALR